LKSVSTFMKAIFAGVLAASVCKSSSDFAAVLLLSEKYKKYKTATASSNTPFKVSDRFFTFVGFV